MVAPLFAALVWGTGCGDDGSGGSGGAPGGGGAAGGGGTSASGGAGGAATSGGEGPQGGGGGAPLSKDGVACADAGECASGYCVDGVCCDTGCDGLCQACTAAATGAADGACASVLADSDPDAECDDASLCGTGACDGSGACGVLQGETLCRASAGACDTAEACDGVSVECPPDTLVAAGATCRAAESACDVEELCDGSTADCPGDVVLGPGTTCNGYACDGTSNLCPTTCATDAACAGGWACVQGQCTPGQRVFITSGTHDGNLGGLAGGDALCQSAADAAGLGGTWRMWLGDATGSPSTRFTQPSAPYYRVDGVMVASSWADLIDGTLLAPIEVSELGAAVAGNVPFTGTNPDGTAVVGNGPQQDDCDAWLSASSAHHGWTGVSFGTDVTWTLGSNSGSARQCNVLHRFYCFEQ